MIIRLICGRCPWLLSDLDEAKPPQLQAFFGTEQAAIELGWRRDPEKHFRILCPGCSTELGHNQTAPKENYV